MNGKLFLAVMSLFSAQALFAVGNTTVNSVEQDQALIADLQQQIVADKNDISEQMAKEKEARRDYDFHLGEVYDEYTQGQDAAHADYKTQSGKIEKESDTQLAALKKQYIKDGQTYDNVKQSTVDKDYTCQIAKSAKDYASKQYDFAKAAADLAAKNDNKDDDSYHSALVSSADDAYDSAQSLYDQAVERALRNNPEVKKAEDKVTKSKAAIDFAKSDRKAQLKTVKDTYNAKLEALDLVYAAKNSELRSILAQKKLDVKNAIKAAKAELKADKKSLKAAQKQLKADIKAAGKKAADVGAKAATTVKATATSASAQLKAVSTSLWGDGKAQQMAKKKKKKKDGEESEDTQI